MLRLSCRAAGSAPRCVAAASKHLPSCVAVQQRSVHAKRSLTLNPTRPHSHTGRRRAFSTVAATATTVVHPQQLQHAALHRWVQAYRTHGHLVASLDPLGLAQQTETDSTESKHISQLLNPSTYGLSLDQRFDSLQGILSLNSQRSATVGEIELHLRKVYSSTMACEYTDLVSFDEQQWWQQQLECPSESCAPPLTPSHQLNVFGLLVQSETLDHFLAKKFASFKRYSLEGGEVMLPMLNELLAQIQSAGGESVVVGMPHRGRLNVLVSLLQFPARQLFHKIQGASLIPQPEFTGCCDVVSHIATSVDRRFSSNAKSESLLHVSLLHNPSHLEAVNCVAAGKTRCKQDELLQASTADAKIDAHQARRKVVCVQLHGDAAFSGQGVVPETLQAAYLPSFHIGGTVHLIVNNQLGFTTRGHTHGRSSRYASDVARMIRCPVLHVNAHDIQACIRASQLAAAYRMRYQKDVIIDLIAYRRHGHNEVDEPQFTQPHMYARIKAQPSIVELYAQQLMEQQLLVSANTQSRLAQKLTSHLESELKIAQQPDYKPDGRPFFKGKWLAMRQPLPEGETQLVTGVEDVQQLVALGRASVATPPGFKVHQRLARTHVQSRLDALTKAAASVRARTIDWATAEAMAFGSLLSEGKSIRLSGQDVERGTFSQRHCVLVDNATEQRHIPFSAEPIFRKSTQASRFVAVNSHLSEFAVLGYEWGYSSETPECLSLWEAQFGDFSQGAQIVIDTYLANAETKWLRQSALTLLLPHGQDGAGPEHSSSRIERFLQLSDDDAFDTQSRRQTNLSVVHPSTPAQYFHLLRRQMLRPFRRPLIVIAPKVLLRLEQCVSSLNEMSSGTRFAPVLDDEFCSDPASIKTLVFCSGKVYFDLCARRTKDSRSDFAFVRIEELTPFPWHEVRAILHRYGECSGSQVSNLVWFQEEHCNQGGFWFVQPRLAALQAEMGSGNRLSSIGLNYCGRQASAVSATGTVDQHKAEVCEIFDELFSY